MSIAVDPWWERPEDELPIDEDWADYVEWKQQQRDDQLRRHEDPPATPCVICHNNSAKSIYGMKCQRCFDAQAEEREAA